MSAVVRSRKFITSETVSMRSKLLTVSIAIVMVGCDSNRLPVSRLDSEDLSVSMPLTADANDVSLVGQPPQLRRELVPTPAGKRDVRGELVPTPAGEPETKSPQVAATPAMNSKPIKLDVPAGPQVPAGGPEQWETWPTPQTVLFVTGNQHGYIEPCGCTGLENQKGGLARRFTFLKQVADRGWPVVPIDAGNQVQRLGAQSEIKFQTAAAGLAEMNYAAIGFGPDDLRLGAGMLISVAAVENPAEGRFISANVVMFDDPSLMAKAKVVVSGGRRIGVTSLIDPESLEGTLNNDVKVGAINESLKLSLDQLKTQQADFKVLMFYGKEEAAAEAVRDTPGFDLLVVAGGYGEPTYQAEKIEGCETKMVVTGNKGMYTGLVGLFSDAPLRYARVALTHEFADAPEMRRLMAAYQDQLESLGLASLGLKPIAHPSGEKFVGTKACGECHKTAFGIWENTPHALATEHLVHPGQRADVSRHFDPECISCHVTGWNAQNFYPYETGYVSLEASSHLTGNGCENCHGPGAKHAAAEQTDSGVEETARDALRVAMRLPLDKAKERCMECHDIDNSPDFHKEGAFEDYWAAVEHYGKD